MSIRIGVIGTARRTTEPLNAPDQIEEAEIVGLPTRFSGLLVSCLQSVP